MSNQRLILSNQLFLKLKHAQLNLIKTTSKETIIDYYTTLANLIDLEPSQNEQTPESSQLIEFLLYPILNVLKRFQLNSDLNEILLKSCRCVLEKFKLFDETIFYEILNICSILLSKNKLQPNQKCLQTEEFTSECFQLIQTLFKRSCEFKILSKFYKFKNLTTIGLLISIFLDTLTQTSSIEVRLEALNSLKEITKFSDKSYEKFHENEASIILASFLPGLSIKLIQKFLLGQNFKLINHKLIYSCVDLFGHVTSLVFNDALLDTDKYKTYFDSCNECQNINSEIRGLIINRLVQTDWVEKSTEKIFFIIEHLLEVLTTSDNLSVQVSLVKFCSIISDQCYFTFNRYLPKILKVLVSFAANDDEKLRKIAFESINRLESKKITLNTNEKFLIHSKYSILDSCFEEILIKLPRIIRAKTNNKRELNDEYRIGQLKTLFGYLKLLGDSNIQKKVSLKNFLILNPNNLNHLIEGLLSCVQFDFDSLDNFYQIDNQHNLMSKTENLSNYNGLKTYLDDKILYEQLQSICSYLGQSDSVRLIIDELLTKEFINSEKFQLKLEVMFIINLLLIGLNEQKENISNDEMSSIISLILTNFLSDFNTLVQDGIEQVESVQISKTNQKNQIILQICLTLESIRFSSKLLTSDDFNAFLIDTLYFILENYLHTNLLIRVVSSQCLAEMASNLNYKNIQDLLSVNFDYIMNDLILKSSNQNRSIKMDKEDEIEEDLNKQTSHVFVLCALLEISNSDVIPYLDRLLNEFMFSIQINTNEVRLILGVCRIMIGMAKSIRRWFPLKYNFIDESESNKDEFVNLNLKKLADARKKSDYSKSFREIVDEINNFMKSNLCEPSENESKDQNAGVEEEDNKSVPLHVRLQTRCLELCTHLISHPSRQVRIQIIDLARELSKNLAEYTNEFLPLVHKLWAPICHRFSLDDLIVKSKIIKLLFDLSVLCSDFISSRFIKEFLPRLNIFMKEQSKISSRSTKVEGSSIGDSTYIYSHAFKLQCAILSNIDKMCVLFEIKEIELENLLDSCVLVYLDKLQPKKLQYLALDSCKNCALIDSDVVWLSLHFVLPFQDLLNDEKLEKNSNYSPEIKLKYNFKFNEDILLCLLKLFEEI